MAPEHIVKAFDEDLVSLDNKIAEMGGLAEVQLADAVDALLKRDLERAARVVDADRRIDDLEREVDQLAVRLIACRQPVAEDLRVVITAMKAAYAIERIGDYARNIAKRAVAFTKAPPTGPAKALTRMAGLVQAMIKNALDAHIARDVAKADAVLRSDEEVDLLYTSLFRELLTYMLEDPRNITPCTHLLFVAKMIERIGDHAANIATHIHFLVKGAFPEEARPKGEGSIFADMAGGSTG